MSILYKSTRGVDDVTVTASQAILQGLAKDGGLFVPEALPTLTEAEIDTLALSCFVLTVELSTRFLADYIDGDLYFKTSSPDHNLVRTRCQIALAKDMQKRMPEMKEIVAMCVAEAE